MSGMSSTPARSTLAPIRAPNVNHPQGIAHHHSKSKISGESCRRVTLLGFAVEVLLGVVVAISKLTYAPENMVRGLLIVLAIGGAIVVFLGGVSLFSFATSNLKQNDMERAQMISNNTAGVVTNSEATAMETFFRDWPIRFSPEELLTVTSGLNDLERGEWRSNSTAGQASDFDATTMEKFFSAMARERPTRFSPQQLLSFTSNYSHKLGSGGFGMVYKGALPSGTKIAVKVLRRNLDERVKEQFMAEVGTIGRIHHINLVRLYGFCFEPTKKALVYEYMENGSLDKFLFSERYGSIGWEKLQEISIGTAKGIAYLHGECQQRIIHYDIKPGNILLDANFSPKVADFGLAKLYNRDSTHVTMSGARGTPGYAAPELWYPIPVTEKCDVYSFGMLLFEIVGRRKNLDINMGESQEWFPRCVWDKHQEQKWETIMDMCGIEKNHMHKAKDMLLVALWCVQYLPESRPPMSGVVKMLEGVVEVTGPPNPFQYLTVEASGISSQSNTTTTATTNTTTHMDATPLEKV